MRGFKSEKRKDRSTVDGHRSRMLFRKHRGSVGLCAGATGERSNGGAARGPFENRARSLVRENLSCSTKGRKNSCRSDGRVYGFRKRFNRGRSRKNSRRSDRVSAATRRRTRGRNLGGAPARLAGSSAHPRTGRHRWAAYRDGTLSEWNPPYAYYRSAYRRMGETAERQRRLGPLQPDAISTRLRASRPSVS